MLGARFISGVLCRSVVRSTVCTLCMDVENEWEMLVTLNMGLGSESGSEFRKFLLWDIHCSLFMCMYMCMDSMSSSMFVAFATMFRILSFDPSFGRGQ